MTNETAVWFITGCSAGFGYELAKQTLERGWRVVLTARRPDVLSKLAANYGERALTLPLDVTDNVQIETAVAEAERYFGHIDVLVNNAGYGYLGAIEEGEATAVRRMFDTNFFGLTALTQRVLPGMRARRHGHIVNFSSIGGLLSIRGVGYYNATKFAVEGLSGALAQELEPLGFGVTIVEPGRFRTEFSGRSLHESATVIDDYAETAGQQRAATFAQSGKQPGDPARGAAAVIDAVSSEAPPLNLLLGTDAYRVVTADMDRRRAEIERWMNVTKSTDFETERQFA